MTTTVMLLSLSHQQQQQYRHFYSKSGRCLFIFGGNSSNPASSLLHSMTSAHTGIRFREETVIGFTKQQIFDVVLNVDDYQHFIPHCLDSQVLKSTAKVASSTGTGDLERGTGKQEASLTVGFSMESAAGGVVGGMLDSLVPQSLRLQETYVSQIEHENARFVKVDAYNSNGQSRLFQHLKNEWYFHDGPTADSCTLVFVVDFKFSSPLYQTVANTFFKLRTLFENTYPATSCMSLM